MISKRLMILKVCLVMVLPVVCLGKPSTRIGAGRSEDQQTFEVKVREVHLAIRAYKSGRAQILDKDSIRIWEVFKNVNGKEERIEQKISTVRSRTEVGLAVSATIDTSGSMNRVLGESWVVTPDKLQIARSACRMFFQALFNPQVDIASISEFYQRLPWQTEKDGQRRWVIPGNLRIIQDWTDDPLKVFKAISEANKPEGLTPLRDAIYELAGHFDAVIGDRLRVLLVVTDGGDNPTAQTIGGYVVNLRSLEEVIERLENQQILVFPIGLYKKGFSFFGLGSQDDILEKMSLATGGEAFFETDLNKLFDVFLEIKNKIRDVNFVSYTPSDQDPGFHAIEVEIGKWDKKDWKKTKGLKIYHRAGYTINK